jgi:hypothetical protein
MLVNFSPLAGAGAQFFDNNGVPLAGGLLYTYFAGTTTPLPTYTSSTGSTANENPIILDSAGRVPEQIWLPNGYATKFVLKNAADVQIWSKDNIPASPQPPIVNDASSITYDSGYSVTAGSFIIGQTYLITSIGSTNFQSIGAVSNTVGIYFIATGIGSGSGTADFIRTVQTKLQDSVSVKDFGAIGDGVADDSAAFNAALVAGNGSITVPFGTYYAKNLTIPVGVTTLSIQGEAVVNNYYERTSSTVIDTKGGDFIKGGATSLLFCARDIFIKSAGQTGVCFGTTSAVETGFYFINVGIEAFEYGFYAPQYSSSSYAYNTSFTDCDYGLWSINVSNNTSCTSMGYNRCANAVRICGFGTTHNGATQLGLGYTGAHSFSEYIGYDLFTGLVSIDDVYTEAYGLDYSKNIIFNCRSTTFGDDTYTINSLVSNITGLRHFRIYSEDLTKAIKPNLIFLTGSVIAAISNTCPNIETKAGQTGLVRGMTVNGKSYSSNSTVAIFNVYDVTANITAGTALVSATVTTFGTSNVTVIGFPTSSIVGYSKILNPANTTTATGRIYFPAPDYYHCPLGLTGSASATLEVSGEIAMDGLAATAEYALGIVYNQAGAGGYVVKQLGLFKALQVPGSVGPLFNFSASFSTQVSADVAASIGICFIPSSTVSVPAAGDITSKLYGTIRVRYVNDEPVT